MKTLLLPFYDDDAAEAALDTAFLIAKRFDSHVEGLFVMRPPQIIDGEGIVLADSYLTQLKEEGRRLGDRARARFERCLADKGVALRELADSGDAPSGSWREVEGLEGQVVGDYGRLFDMVVIGRDFGHPWVDWHVMGEAALFESGRPVLVAPNQPGEDVGRRIVVAWNASTETARTVAMAKPFLSRADSVVVLSVESWGVPGPSGEQLATHLARHGIAVSARTVAPEGRSPGDVILDACASEGADLLVKGAYTQSRLRQLVFGGATRQLLNNAKIPVFFVH